MRIWADNPDALYWWYYGESARMPDVAKPYRQNVFQIVPQADGSVFAFQYRVREPAKAAGFGAWARTSPPSPLIGRAGKVPSLAGPECTTPSARAG